jgi:hypothetical protein
MDYEIRVFMRKAAMITLSIMTVATWLLILYIIAVNYFV